MKYRLGTRLTELEVVMPCGHHRARIRAEQGVIPPGPHKRRCDDCRHTWIGWFRERSFEWDDDDGDQLQVLAVMAARRRLHDEVETRMNAVQIDNEFRDVLDAVEELRRSRIDVLRGGAAARGQEYIDAVLDTVTRDQAERGGG